jgi:hypothetical protein
MVRPSVASRMQGREAGYVTALLPMGLRSPCALRATSTLDRAMGLFMDVCIRCMSPLVPGRGCRPHSRRHEDEGGGVVGAGAGLA